MEFLIDKFKKELSKNLEEFESIYGDILDKVLNENASELHTMLMKSDFENYLLLSDLEKSELSEVENADLSDLNSYEEVLKKQSDGAKTR